MPLIRREAAAAPPAADFAAALKLLSSGEAGLRRQAVRLLGEVPPGTPQADEATAALTAHLAHESEPLVREAAFLAFSQLGGAKTAALVGAFLRTEDAALRNGALETLKRLGDAAAGAVDELLRDPDPDVRLLTIEVMRNWPAQIARPRLEFLLTREPQINVCGVAVDIAMAVGDASLLPALRLCRQRFAGQFFLEFAIDAAIAALTPPPADPGPMTPVAAARPPKPKTRPRRKVQSA